MRSRYNIWLKIGIVVFAAGLIFLCTMVVRDSGEFYAESKDGTYPEAPVEAKEHIRRMCAIWAMKREILAK